jgi:hypothetical protein
MKSATELLSSSQRDYVNSSSSVHTAIKYAHQDGFVESLNVFVSENEFNKNKIEKSEASATISNVFLTQKPEVNDAVLFENENKRWTVKTWRKLNDMYIIELTSQRYKI